MSINNNLEKYSYEQIIQNALEQVPDDIDKREGSIIYDALSPACYELAQFYLNLVLYSQETYAVTATGEWLELRAKEQGINRREATKAVRVGHFYKNDDLMDITIGERFMTLSDYNQLIYIVTAPVVTSEGVQLKGQYELTCEAAGTVGNIYSGQIVPINYIPDLTYATLLEEVVINGEDEETDESLRSRYLYLVNNRPFGGNISDYYQLVTSIAGVGGVQVYPVWDGGGTVKLSVIDRDYNPINNEKITEIQNYLDPENSQEEKGTGLGQVPVGHKVTVVTPIVKPINFEIGNATPKQGYTLEQVKQELTDILNEYIEKIKINWDRGDTNGLYNVSLLNMEAIAAISVAKSLSSFTDIAFNGFSNLNLTESASIQEIPKMGEVVFVVG